MRGQGRLFRPRVRRRDGARRETSVWWLDYSVRGKRHYESSHTVSKQEALRLLRQRIGERETGKLVGTPGSVTFNDLRVLVERQYLLDGRRSLRRVRQALDHLGRFFGLTARAVDIAPTDIDSYVEGRLAEGAACHGESGTRGAAPGLPARY